MNLLRGKNKVQIEVKRVSCEAKVNEQKFKSFLIFLQFKKNGVAEVEALKEKRKSVVTKHKQRHVEVVKHYMAKVRKEKENRSIALVKEKSMARNNVLKEH